MVFVNNSLRGVSRATALTSALVLVVVSFLAGTSPVASAAPPAAPAPAVSRPAALPGQAVTFTGDISTAVVRPVELQYRSGTSWKTVTSGSTRADGSYTLTTHASATRVFKVRATKVGARPAVDSATVEVTLLDDSLTLAVSTADAETATAVGQAAHVQPGRLVAFQYRSGKTWKRIGLKVAEDSSGRVQTSFPVGSQKRYSARSYRIVADSTYGSDEPHSPTISFMRGPSHLGPNVLRITTKDAKTPTRTKDRKGTVSVNGAAPVALDGVGLRGDSTARLAKKPLKLKFAKKNALFGMPADKRFNLLASYIDPSLIRDKVGLDLGASLSHQAWTPRNAYTEVFLNSTYLGSYLATESVKIDKNRSDVSKTRGIIVEVDGTEVASGKFGFMSSHGSPIVFKDPDEVKHAPDDDPAEGYTKAKEAALKKRVKAVEKVLYGSRSKLVNRETGWRRYIDEDAVIDYYLVKEFTKDNDADFYRSIYFTWNDYTDPDAKFVFGPVWDFDRSAGVNTDPNHRSQASSQGWYLNGDGLGFHPNHTTSWFVQLNRDPSFRKALRTRWKQVKPQFKAVYQTRTAQYAADLEVAGANDRARWGSNRRYTPHAKTTAGEITWVTSWYHRRYSFMNDHLS